MSTSTWEGKLGETKCPCGCGGLLQEELMFPVICEFIAQEREEARREGLDEGLATANKGKTYHTVHAEAKREGLKTLAPWIDRDMGASSKTLYMHMVGEGCSWPSSPADNGDRARCIVLLNLVPEWWARLDEMKCYAGWESQVSLIRKEAALEPATPNSDYV